MHVLGTRITYLPKDELHTQIQRNLDVGEACQIVSLNAEILLTANKNKKFRDILNQSLQIIDGVSVQGFTQWKRKEVLSSGVQRITGIDLMEQLLEKVSQNDSQCGGVFLLAPTDGLSSWKQTATTICERYPGVVCSGLDVARTAQKEFTALHVSDACAAIDRSGAKYVFCSFGAPWQEYFLDNLKNARLEKPCVYMGVGGSFDYLTGHQKRAPLWMRTIGLEWLYRLIKQPHRIGRICRAVIIFPYKVLTYK